MVGLRAEKPPFAASAARFGRRPSAIPFSTSAWSAPSKPRTMTRGGTAASVGSAAASAKRGARKEARPRRGRGHRFVSGMGHSSCVCAPLPQARPVDRHYIKVVPPLVRAIFLGVGLLGISGAAQAQVVTEFGAGISAGAFPTSIAAGPDGNLWFTEYTGSRIGRITPTGVVTEFVAGISPNRRLGGIASGPDGNLWITETGDRIGRITPLGIVTEFSTSFGSFPALITAGPDGNLWFTEQNAGIGRITPAGFVTEFSSGITGTPAFITAGPDGNLWFTELNNNRIGRITPLGVITEFDVGITGNGLLNGITTGPDGNLWFV